jgi:hypothetical protein
MSALFYEYSNGSVGIGFFYQSRIGLDNGNYLSSGNLLTEELRVKINARLQELWKTDRELLISLVRERKSKEIYDLFGIKEMDNGWFLEKWYLNTLKHDQEGKNYSNLLKFEYRIDQKKRKKIEDQKWKLFQLKWQVSAGTLRVKRLQRQVNKKLRRSFSTSELYSSDKMEEHPFFLEKWGLGKPVKVKTPEFLKLKEIRRPKMERKGRGGP